MITWGTVIDIILETFDKKQTEFSKATNSNTSSISRIISGKIHPTFTAKELYDAIFNPEIATSFVHNAGPKKYWLGILKDTITEKFKEVREDMDDCWDEENYEKFILNLLSRAKTGASSKKKAQASIETPAITETAPKLTPIRRPNLTNSSKTQPPPLKHTETQSENNLPPR